MREKKKKKAKIYDSKPKKMHTLLMVSLVHHLVKCNRIVTKLKICTTKIEIIQRIKQGQQGPQKLSSLKLLKIQNPPPIPGTLTTVIINNDFLIKF